MLRKTAVIAVLILVITSFTLGSTVRVQTVTAAGNEGVTPEQFTHERGPAGLPPMADSNGEYHLQKTGRTVGHGYMQYMPDEADAFPPAAVFVGAGFVHIAPGMEGPVQHVVSFASAGRSLQMPETLISEGHVQDLPDAGFTTMVIYMNDSKLERSAMPGFSYAAPGEWQIAGTAGGVQLREGGMPDNLTIKTRMAMLKPGGAPEFYELMWKMAYMGKRAEAGPVAFHSGHMIPARNGSFEKVAPFGFIGDPAIGTIEFNGDMVVDMANLPVDWRADASADQTNDTYNNEISAGETNWHSASVGDAIKSVNVDLKWKDPDGKLRLLIYTPDGKVLGPYYDDADGKEDARINLNVTNPSGVASGEWHLKVTDMTTLGNNDYYVRTY